MNRLWAASLRGRGEFSVGDVSALQADLTGEGSRMLDRPHVPLETNDMSTDLVLFNTSSGYVDEIDTFCEMD
jgi:hypothetical protein